MNSLFRISMLAVVSIAMTGCGGSDRPAIYPVIGTVTFDGKPLPDASVTFMPDQGLVAVGKTDSSGHFSLKTQGTDGAAEGLYHIVVTATEQGEKISPEEFEKLSDAERRKLSKSLIPARYSHPKTSELTATITADQENEIPIELSK